MCDSDKVLVIQSNPTKLIRTNNNEMTLIPAEINVQSVETSKLKRTFTLPRNPFNTVRMSKRKLKPNNNSNNIDNTTDNNKNVTTNEADKNNKKVFRRPSIRKFINKIAQHIGGVPGINPNIDNNRVPPVGLQTWGPDDTPGVTGLKNHGNTCFINAVLQCISHTDVLAEYFVLDRYKIDLSRRNKLNSKKFGTKGEVTEQLALLLKALWACQYSPELSTTFKQVVERHGSQYKGTQQHDALEFLQWLLDKVHEDLNTASKKKYKSIKTSGRPDEVIAAETLENYKRCNNSFIQGVFQAQYRSSLSCSRCRTQSNTFDPFQCISVQLPQFHKHSIYVYVLYTSQQPRQVQIGLSLPSGATVSELRDILESDTSIDRANMLITEIGEAGFLRTFTDAQSINIITEIDPIYCIEVAQLKDVEEDTTSAYALLCWINVVVNENSYLRFGSPYTMQVSRETSYDDLQKLLLKEMASILHDDVLTSSQPRGVFKIRISDPACNDNEPACYLDPELEHPLFMEAVDQALALCSEDGGPPHVKLVLEWTEEAQASIIAVDVDVIEEHSSVKHLRTQALQGGAPLTLEECLRDYTEAETLSDAWRCPHCQQYQPAVKTLDVWSLPDILIVHFKRFRHFGNFRQSLRGCSSAKLTTMVDFPVYGFDMSPHLANKRNTNLNSGNIQGGDNENSVIMSATNGGWSPWKRARKQSNSNDNLYDLYAVCYHHGTDLETGHYTAACKNPYDNQWYLYDDANVVNLSKEANNDITSILVNNSAYILFYQKRNGIFNGSSSNSSSAASTSSVGSSVDHWVSRMPKFVPPKNIRATSEKQHNVGDGEKIEVPEPKPVNVNDDGGDHLDVSNDDVVALRNSQNTLNSSSREKVVETKSTNTVVSCTKASPTLSQNSVNVISNNNQNECSVQTPSPPLYTTSIYINSSGNVDVTTTTTTANTTMVNSEKSPGLSLRRIDGLLLEDGSGNCNETVYTTTAAVHRYSDIGRNEKCNSTQLDWMSPQPMRKLRQSQQSV